MVLKDRAFISHSSKDKKFAWRLVRDFNSYNLPVWFDARELRPGVNINQTLKAEVSASKYFIILVSRNSIQSKWVQLELKQALKSQQSSRNPIVIPAIIDSQSLTKVPALKKIMYADFTKDYYKGFSDLLRGTFRDSQIVVLRIKKDAPFELETDNFEAWCEEYLALKKQPIFVLDDLGMLEEISRVIGKSRVEPAEILKDARYFSLVRANFCLLLPKYIASIKSHFRSDNDFLGYVMNSLQSLFKLVFYQIYAQITLHSPDYGLEIAHKLRKLRSIKVPALEPIVYKAEEALNTNANAVLLNLINPLAFDLVGMPKNNIMNIGPIYASKDDLPSDLTTFWQAFCSPAQEISDDLWLKVCMPQIGQFHIVTCSSSGKTLTDYLPRVGLRIRDYYRLGPP